ncbi:DUF3841 domain-containing protein [Radiobacillus deserti]|uniref:DUF3841 domain-containing protein n=1 Tax=Radiobacillus deserti TaxID=2594883 RepID=UPI001E63DB28|nr:DUF3841 domain-containing protein [Radiobacillus deserti]
MTVEVPDNKVLLSNFDAWHCVLNDWFCSMTNEEDELFVQGKLNITKEQSWERIFDIEKIRKSELCKKLFAKWYSISIGTIG